MPIPSFAEARIASSPGMASASSNSPRTRAGSALGKIDFIDHRHQREMLFIGEDAIRHRLRLHPLHGIHHQDGAFARREAARHFVMEIHMARGIDQVQFIIVPSSA